MSVCVAGVERPGCKRIERTCVLWWYGGIERVGVRGGRGQYCVRKSVVLGIERLRCKRRERTCEFSC